jgi:hypothetical protein
LTSVHLAQAQPPFSWHDEINRGRIAIWTSRNRRLATVLVGVQGLLEDRGPAVVNNNNATRIPDGLWLAVLNAAMEDIDRNKSALYLIMCRAIIGGGGGNGQQQEGEGGEGAGPLHDKIVQALRNSAAAAARAIAPEQHQSGQQQHVSSSSSSQRDEI